MECTSCNGTGDGNHAGDRNCSECNGTGHLCNICGGSVEEGMDTCDLCMDDGEEDDFDEE